MHHTTVTVARSRQRALPARIAACSLAVLLGGTSASGGPPAAVRRPAAPAPTRIVDHAVVPAGGIPCRQCGRAGSPLHHGHLGECRDGLCAPHCPVRPGEYGYYHTQWRRWPGQGVVPASAEEAATPVRPPASQVPTIDEESPRLPDDSPTPPPGNLPSDPIPEAAPVDGPAARPDPEPVARPEPAKPAETPRPVVPVRPTDAAKPAGEPPLPADEAAPVPPTPPGEKPAPPATDTDDLFDQSAVPPVTDEPIDAGAMRYPAQVGRSLAAGAVPWRLEAASRQRAAASDRGL